MITTLDKNMYQAGWLETHSEPLDEQSLLNALHDEHNALIDALISDDARDPSTLYFILREGFEGYINFSVAELWEEMNTRGLTL